MMNDECAVRTYGPWIGARSGFVTRDSGFVRRRITPTATHRTLPHPIAPLRNLVFPTRGGVDRKKIGIRDS